MSVLSWGLVQGLQRSIAAFNRHTPTSIRPGQVEREVQIEEVATEWGTVQDPGGGAGTDCQDLVGARPVKCEFGLEHLGVRIRGHTLAGGRIGDVHPFTTTHS